jgi:hypothetical protein
MKRPRTTLDLRFVPRAITYSCFESTNWSWAPSNHELITLRTTNRVRIADLLESYSTGTEAGSAAYMRSSPRYFLRTKALQDYFLTTELRHDALSPMNPRAYDRLTIEHGERVVGDGEILYARGGEVGEVAIAAGLGSALMSSHLIKLAFRRDPLYALAFLKHPLIKAQQQISRRGSIGALDNFDERTLLDAVIPFPNQADSDSVISLVSAITQCIIDLEIAMRARHIEIYVKIRAELENVKTKPVPFAFSQPRFSDVHKAGRLDTGLYERRFAEFSAGIAQYKDGATTMSAMGVVSRRGPNLAVSVINDVRYSDEPHSGWYELIRPVHITEYGTLLRREWLGTKKNLPTVQSGDLILGCEGFEKGRSLVVVEPVERCTTNFHGAVLSWPKHCLDDIVFVRCFLAFLRQEGVMDLAGVGGSGGHMSPEYFDQLPFPRFGADRRANIARSYRSGVTRDLLLHPVGTLIERNRLSMSDLGVIELDRRAKSLRASLEVVQESIILGLPVAMPGP